MGKDPTVCLTTARSSRRHTSSVGETAVAEAIALLRQNKSAADNIDKLTMVRLCPLKMYGRPCRAGHRSSTVHVPMAMVAHLLYPSLRAATRKIRCFSCPRAASTTGCRIPDATNKSPVTACAFSLDDDAPTTCASVAWCNAYKQFPHSEPMKLMASALYTSPNVHASHNLTRCGPPHRHEAQSQCTP